MTRRPFVSRREKRRAARDAARAKRYNARWTVFGYTEDYAPSNRLSRKRDARCMTEGFVPCERLEAEPRYFDDEPWTGPVHFGPGGEEKVRKLLDMPKGQA
jgi:hypothetical protein